MRYHRCSDQSFCLLSINGCGLRPFTPAAGFYCGTLCSCVAPIMRWYTRAAPIFARRICDNSFSCIWFYNSDLRYSFIKSYDRYGSLRYACSNVTRFAQTHSQSIRSFAPTDVVPPLHSSFAHYIHSLPTQRVGCKWGVRGEGGEASGSPRRYTAKITF